MLTDVQKLGIELLDLLQKRVTEGVDIKDAIFAAHTTANLLSRKFCRDDEDAKTELFCILRSKMADDLFRDLNTKQTRSN